MYQKLWAREKAIKKKAMISEPVTVESTVESIRTEAIFCIQYYELIELKKQHKLKDFAYWIMNIRRVNKEIIKMKTPIVTVQKERKIIRQRINGELTGLWFYLKESKADIKL
jgi:hypothetical protein